MNSLSNCVITERTPSNDEWTSDHLPIRSEFSITIKGDNCYPTETNDVTDIPKFTHVDWYDDNVRKSFEQHVSAIIEQMEVIEIDYAQTREHAQNIVNQHCKKLTDVLHKASEEAMSQKKSKYQGRHRKVPWWNNDCTIARDRMRFWRNIWQQCDRIRYGVIFLCYKMQKRYINR